MPAEKNQEGSSHVEGWIKDALGLGLGGVALMMLYVLHREALTAFRTEMITERDRNDRNLLRLWEQIGKLTAGFDEAKCRYKEEK